MIQPFRVALGLETKDDYLTNRLKYSPYPVFEYINKNLSDKDKIFFVGEQRSFYCKKKYIASNVFAPNPLIDWANNSKNYLELINKMKSYGITHVIYNKNEGQRLLGYGIFNFSLQGKKNWEELISNTKLLFHYNEVYLYSLE